MVDREQTTGEELLRKEMNRLNRMLRLFTKNTGELTDKQSKVLASMQKNYTAMEASTKSLQKTVQIGKNWAQRENENIKIMKMREKLSSQEFRQRRALQEQYSDNIISHIKLKNVMGKSSDQFAFFTNALTKGLGFGEAIGMATEKLREMTQTVMLHKEAEEKRRKFDEDMKSGDLKKSDDNYRARKEEVEKAEKDASKLSDPSKKGGLTGMLGKKLGKIGEFASKHKGGMLLGAGAGGLILGVIIKALSVAPMFQQMMKLFKFTVSLILMPIGTFFGAVLRPILISLIRGIAPNFKDWMKTSMDLGDKVGKGILELFTDPIGWFTNAFSNLFNLLPNFISTSIDSLITSLTDIMPTFPDVFAEESPEEKEKKQKEHDAYWKKFNDDMAEIGKAIMRPILTFIGYLNSFFIVMIPDAIKGAAKFLQDGLDWIGTELLKPLWMFIGTLNTLFFVQLPEFLGSIGERFGEFWEGVFDGIKKFIYGLPVIGKTIEGYFEKSDKNLKDTPNEARNAAHHVEGIAKIFDSVHQWISNALSGVSQQTYTKADGSVEPTAAATTAMAVLNKFGVGSIDASGNSSSFNFASKSFQKMATGGMITEPIFGIGKSGKSYLLGEAGNEMVTPMSQVSNTSAGATINIHIGKIEKDADFNQLKPMIQRWILEANSRRGMI
jgi:hypothetical protein